jgi:tetratricopeptide (TPR) repeat protein
MIKRNRALFCLTAFLLVLGGCDLEGVVKKKVPEPLKNLLTFGSPDKGKGKDGPVQFTPTHVEIASPMSSILYPVEKPVEFRAMIRLPVVPGQPRPSLMWTLFSDKDKQGISLGVADIVNRKLEPGKYRVELAATYQGQKVVKRVDFRTALMMHGSVMETKDKGVPQVEIVLSDLDETKQISTSQTASNGQFAIEVPSEGPFLITVRKQGYSFSPLKKIVQSGAEPVKLEFVGLPAEIKNIRLTAAQDSDEREQSICPLHEAFLKFDLTSAIKPARMEASLFRIERGRERRIPLEKVKEEEKVQGGAESDSYLMKVQIPAALAGGETKGTYRLTLTLIDDKENSFSAEANDPVTYDIAGCLRSTLDQAVALHRQSKFEEAIKLYNIMEELNKRADDFTPFVERMEKARFNRGLAYLAQALALKPEDVDQFRVLNRAQGDFNHVLKRRKNDLEAILFRGLVKQLSGSMDEAVQDYNEVISADPKMMTAYDLRAQAYLKTQNEPCASLAVDDFTRAINLNSPDSTLRKSRRETLKLLVKVERDKEQHETQVEREVRTIMKDPDCCAGKDPKKDPDCAKEKIPLSEKLDINSIPLSDMSTSLNLEKYVRH